MQTNITLTSKYLEDENGSKFAPITTPNAVRFPDGTNLNDHLGGAQVTPIVLLGQPSGDIYAYTIYFDSSASKFYQYLWDDNQDSYTWQEIATLEKAFGYYSDGQGIYGFYEIDNGVLSQTLIERLEAGWYSDFCGQYAQNAGAAGTIIYFDEFGHDYRTVNWNETDRWDNKSDFSGDYNDLSNKPTIPTVNNATLTIQKNGTPVATFTSNASSNVTANITVPTGDLASINKDGVNSTKYLRGDATWQTFPTIPTVPTNVSAFTNDAGYITSSDIAGKEDKMSIVVATNYPTTLSPAINTLTKVTMQSSLTVTLPTISTNTDKVQSLVLHLTTASDYTPNLIISGSGISIEYPPDFTIESGTSYEINCMWIGNATWAVASQEIQDFGA